MHFTPKYYINLILKSRADNNKSFHKKRIARRFIATSLLLKPFQQPLVDVTSFRLSKSLYSRSVLFKRTNNSGSVFPIRLDRRIYKTQFPTHPRFSPPPPNSFRWNMLHAASIFRTEIDRVKLGSRYVLSLWRPPVHYHTYSDCCHTACCNSFMLRTATPFHML